MSDGQFVTNAGHLAARMRKRADTLQNRFRTTARRYADTLRQTAEELSSGTLSTADLRRMGNPYARLMAAGSAGVMDFIINVQTGNLRGSWVTRVQKVGDSWTITLFNTAPEAKFMVGTKKMRVRPILEEVIRRHGHDLPNDVHKAIDDVIKRDPLETGFMSPFSGGGEGSAMGGLAYAVAVGVGSIASSIDGGL